MTANKFNHRLLLAAALLPVLLLQACSGASSGHAPGVAGGESLLPGTTNYPLAYVKQPVPTTDIDVRDLITSITGGDLYIRDQASAAGAESNVTSSITLGKGAVRDLDVSPDGSKLVFALRLPLDPKLKNDDPKQPNWKIYQYDALAKTVTQLTTDDITAGHDIGPHYLPDGRIVFASTRQAATQAILLNEGREQYPAQIQPEGSNNGNTPIFLLHVMNADGSMIHQISFNTDHDFAPSVLNNGQIVFSPLGDHQRRRSDQPVPDQSGRHRAGALLWLEQPCHGGEPRRQQRQRDPVSECAPARRRQAAGDGAAVPRHPAGRRRRAHRCR